MAGSKSFRKKRNIICINSINTATNIWFIDRFIQKMEETKKPGLLPGYSTIGIVRISIKS